MALKNSVSYALTHMNHIRTRAIACYKDEMVRVCIWRFMGFSKYLETGVLT